MSWGSTRPQQIAATLGLLAVVTAPPAAARRVVLPCTKDTTIFGPFQTQISNGSGPRFFVGRTNRFGTRRGLLQFPIADSLPPNAHVDSVQLALHCDRTTSGPFSVHVHRLSRDWGEAGSFSFGGGGAIAQPNDATWLHTFYDQILWTTPGGDFESTASAEQSVGLIGSYTWHSTPALIADVQLWVDDPAKNFGWILIGDETTTSAKRFQSRESEVLDERPLLIVDWTPATAVLPVTWGTIKSLYASPRFGSSRLEVKP